MKRSTHSRSRRAFTLIELMIAVGILSVLGLMLITSLRSVVRVVATGTSRGDGVAAAQAILARAEADLEQLFAGPGGRLVAGRDPYGRPFLALVRTLPEERSMIGGYYAGMDSGQPQPWRGFANDGNFLPMGGLCEVAWLMKPTIGQQGLLDPASADFGATTDDTLALYRGQIAPIGGIAWARGESPDRHQGLLADLEKWSANAAGEPEMAGLAFRGKPFNFDSKYQLVADNVLYFGVELWDKDTATWNSIGTSNWLWDTNDAAAVSASGASTTWPDVGATADPPPTTLGSPFPRAAKITVTVGMGRPLNMEGRLVAEMTANDTNVYTDTADGWMAGGTGVKYIRVEQEWMEFTEASAGTFYVKRGCRGTRAVPHKLNAPVRMGLTLSRVVTLPAGR